MIVAIRFAVVAAGAVAKIYLVNQTGFLQVTQGVVNSCVTDARESPAGRFEDVAGSRVVVAFLDHLKDGFSLRRQLRFWLHFLHDEFRLILNHRFVKSRIRRIFTAYSVRVIRVHPWLNNWVLLREVDYLIDVGFEGWAVDAVRGEQLLSLGGVVELFDEEIRDGVMW
jgi:hypothetical protein